MEGTLSVDVGLHGLGCGYFGPDRALLAGWYAPRPAGVATRGPEAWRGVASTLAGLELDPGTVVVETMQVYDTRKGRSINPADLLELQGICGAVGMRYPRARLVSYLPRVWKAQVPQHVLASRVWSWLEGKGWRGAVLLPGRVGGKDRDHDVLHGIGIGLHHLGWMRAGKFVR